MIRDALGVNAVPPVNAITRRGEDMPPQVTAQNPEPSAAPEAGAQFNPNLRLDAALNMVVIEFRDTGGEVVRSIPSEREIAAYRHGEREEPKTLTPHVDVKG
jgi:hypothetical protein